jgi:hypothetical protein
MILAFALFDEVNCSKVRESNSGKMDDKKIEALLAAGDYALSSILDSVPRKEYPFIRKYIHASNADVRDLAGLLLIHVSQPWVFPYYLELLKDPVPSIASLAADGIYRLSLPEKKDVILQEIERISALDSGDSRRLLAHNLILAAGNTCGIGDVDRLLILSKKEPSPKLQVEYQKALAKIGYQKSIREIEFQIANSDGFGKVGAIRKVEYINQASWMPKIVPLLLDEEIGATAQRGPATFRWRVCDKAIDVLRILDPEKRINFPKTEYTGYTREQVRNARHAYGLKTK